MRGSRDLGQGKVGPQATAHILMVDDRPANLLSLVGILEPLGQILVQASSGEEALRQVLEHDFAVILMDLRMPGLDGMKTAQLIRQRERSAQVPIIFLTAVAIETADIMLAYKEGAVDFLLKPFEPEILRSKVKVFVDLYHKEEMIKFQAALLRQRDRLEFQRRGEIRFRNLLDAMPLCVLGLRPNGMVYYWNRMVADYLGKPAGDAPDSSPLEIVCLEDRDRIGESWQAALTTGEPLETQFRMRRESDGANRWHLCRIVPQRTEEGGIVSWLWAATDIDGEHEARSSAEAANRMKDEFLATVSHELRNPLNAILGWTKVLRSGKLDEEKTAQALSTIERNAQSQTALIEDLLDVSRAIQGKLHLNFTTVDMVQVVESAVATSRPSADAKELVLECRLTGDACQVNGDSDRLQQVVGNLLSNAIKFTPSGGTVTISLRRAETRVELIISDTGQGISPELLPHVFDRFRQGDSGPTRFHQGLGLGLAISRQLVELHEGTIRAESGGPGKGATFTVQLPLQRTDTDGGEIFAPESDGEVSLHGIKVLVIDDEADTREVMVEILTGYGAQVIAAASAQEGITAVRTCKPDVLISDIGMPFEDGYSLIRKMRALSHEEGGLTPACALTGWGTAQESERALAAGFQAHLKKPITPEKLATAIYQLSKGAQGDQTEHRTI
jgi:PAS domain S-box-containing protein